MKLSRPMKFYDGKLGPETDADLDELLDASEEPFVFENMSFNGLDFEGMDLNDANFRSSDARAVNFQSIEAQRANFDDTKLFDANFVGADLREASFKRADLREANLGLADLRGTSFEGATLDSCFDEAILSENTTLSKAHGRIRLWNGITVDGQKLGPEEALRWFAARMELLEEAP